jgi:hypothetical protein
VCFAAASFVSAGYIVSHQAHDCPGEDCPLCLLIQGTENFSRHLKCAASCPGFPAAVLLAAVFVLKFAAFRFIPLNAVQLKVKMNR